jgi:hypothetical protein
MHAEYYAAPGWASSLVVTLRQAKIRVSMTETKARWLKVASGLLLASKSK